jgi:hypothetical protein
MQHHAQRAPDHQTQRQARQAARHETPPAGAPGPLRGPFVGGPADGNGEVKPMGSMCR